MILSPSETPVTHFVLLIYLLSTEREPGQDSESLALFLMPLVNKLHMTANTINLDNQLWKTLGKAGNLCLRMPLINQD